MKYILLSALFVLSSLTLTLESQACTFDPSSREYLSQGYICDPITGEATNKLLVDIEAEDRDGPNTSTQNNSVSVNKSLPQNN